MSKQSRATIVAKNVAEVTAAVQGEEAGAFEFLRSTIKSSGGKKKNEATFKELPAGTQPKPIVFVEGSQPPDGTSKVWSGKMVLDGAEKFVTAGRKN